MAECNMKKTIKEFFKVIDVKIEKMKFHRPKEVLNVNDVHIKKKKNDNRLVCLLQKPKIADAKYLIGYKNDKTNIRPLYIELLQMTGFLN